jgi:predicted DNA-binding antitoxin AbrB/MazE fold protein
MIKTTKDLFERVEKFKIDKKVDLSSGEDLSIGIMNLISIEEHLFYTSQKTKDKKYLDMLNEVRVMRTDLMKRLVKDPAGEVWCISKHLLAASMRLMEVGTKELKKKNDKEAQDLFKKSYELYTLFWGLNLSSDSDTSAMPDKKYQGVSVFAKLGAVVQKAIDCCIE